MMKTTNRGRHTYHNRNNTSFQSGSCAKRNNWHTVVRAELNTCTNMLSGLWVHHYTRLLVSDTHTHTHVAHVHQSPPHPASKLYFLITVFTVQPSLWKCYLNYGHITCAFLKIFLFLRHFSQQSWIWQNKVSYNLSFQTKTRFTKSVGSTEVCHCDKKIFYVVHAQNRIWIKSSTE